MQETERSDHDPGTSWTFTLIYNDLHTLLGPGLLWSEVCGNPGTFVTMPLFVCFSDIRRQGKEMRYDSGVLQPLTEKLERSPIPNLSLTTCSVPRNAGHHGCDISPSE